MDAQGNDNGYSYRCLDCGQQTRCLNAAHMHQATGHYHLDIHFSPITYDGKERRRCWSCMLGNTAILKVYSAPEYGADTMHAIDQGAIHAVVVGSTELLVDG